MTSASKILTVSYGTFSCTLEGFDDPFSTMKAIAEYFRDLAADDRYFGAEPPTPDSAMLHRIAEDATQRRVQAQVQGNGVVLRQGDAIIAADAALLHAPTPAPTLLSSDQANVEIEEAAARLAQLRAEIDQKSKHISALEAKAAAAATREIPADTASDSATNTAIETIIDLPKDSYTEDSDSIDTAPPADLAAVAGDAASAAAHPPITAAPRRVLRPDPHTYAQTIRGGESSDVLVPQGVTPKALNPEIPTPDAAITAPQASVAPALSLAPTPAANPAEPKYRVEVVRAAQNTVSNTPALFAAESAAIDTPRARVIRIRRVAQTGGIANAAPSAAAQPKMATLSASQEAALSAELAALDAPAPPLVVPQIPLPAAPRAKINPSDDTLDKLIARANTDLADDNVRRRQAAISHMKAAAAATEADRVLGAGANTIDAVLDTYRDALDKVASEGGPRSAPLVLVSEQRIDRSEAKRSDAPLKLAPALAAPPLMPLVENIFRASDDEDEASGPQTNVFTGMETFEDFADRLGASEQIDLMEAAAIYVAHIEKQPLFRRRQLIRHMSSLQDTLPLSREATLQTFNQLLSIGRFAEMEPGLFAVTDRSPLLAEALREAI